MCKRGLNALFLGLYSDSFHQLPIRTRHVRGAHAYGDTRWTAIDVPAPASSAFVFNLGVATLFAVM